MSEPESAARGPDEVLTRLKKALGDRYEIRGRAGAGAMAAVYVAEDLKHGRSVAIKVPLQPLTAGTGPERFRREVSIAAKLNHPHIVPLHDSGVAAGLPYYVMPFVEGETLEARLAREGPLPLEAARAIASDVADALDHAHARGVVHRDVKPANILLSGGHALVSDFGVARALDLASGTDVTTTQGGSVGTLAYMSPEQALGEEGVDRRSDVYSLGCVVYEMLTGETPFTARTPAGVVAAHLQGSVPDLGPRVRVPAPVSEAVARSLAKEPEDRFPTAGAFVRAMAGEGPGSPAAARGGRRPGVRGGRWWWVAGAAVLVVAAGVLWVGSRPVPLEGRPESVVVLPFETATSSDEEKSSAADLAARVASELNRWDSIHAVPRVALSGPMFDLGLEGPTVATVPSGLQVARALDVQAMLAVSVSLGDGEASVEATLYDVGTGRPLERPLGLTGGPHSADVVRRLAWGVLGLDADDPGLEVGELHRYSSSARALTLFAEGSRHLERWRLEEARRTFAATLDADPDFALAYHRLAQALYWRAAPDPRSLGVEGPEIARLSAEAVGRSRGLPLRDSLHVRAFDAFGRGRYDEARALYTELLAGQPTDPYALLMLGSTEFQDRALRTTPDGGVEPRSNLNVAVRAFEEALRLQPTFELGYGHLFDIHLALADAAYLESCMGFEEPGSRPLAPWEAEPPARQRAFCPVVGDSIRWVGNEEFRRMDRGPALRGADRMFRESLRVLERWVAFAPDRPVPLETLADVLTRRRLTMRLGTPEEQAALAERARDAADSALALRADTTSNALHRLANLHLASGDVDGALHLRRLAEARRGDGPPPPAAANVPLATGRLEAALEVVSTPRMRWFLEGQEGRLVSYGGGVVEIDRANVLAGVTAGGTRLLDELNALEGRWTGPDYDEEDRSLLRADATRRVIAALAADTAARREWASRVALDHPLWRGLTDPDPDPVTARMLVESALTERTPGMTEAARSFAAGHVALRAGDHASAVRLFSRLDSIALSVDFLATGWGLRALSHYWRGRALEDGGRPLEAVRHYEAFRRTWREADDLASPVLADARRRAARLQGGR